MIGSTWIIVQLSATKTPANPRHLNTHTWRVPIKLVRTRSFMPRRYPLPIRIACRGAIGSCFRHCDWTIEPAWIPTQNSGPVRVVVATIVPPVYPSVLSPTMVSPFYRRVQLCVHRNICFAPVKIGDYRLAAASKYQLWWNPLHPPKLVRKRYPPFFVIATRNANQ